MKVFFNIIILLCAIGIIILLTILFFIHPHFSQPSNINISTQFPVSSTEPNQIPINQSVSTDMQQKINQAFLAQIPNATSTDFIFTKTVVVGNYAIQEWKSPNGESAGDSLLEYDPQKGWFLINVGGGWTVSSLVSEGVPQSVAEQLIARLP